MTEEGEALIGATITVKEVPGKGTVTDADGRFKLTDLQKGQTGFYIHWLSKHRDHSHENR